jgi:hypothetical protein
MDNPEKQATLGTQDKRQRQTKQEHNKDNPEKQATLGTQDNRQRQTKQEHNKDNPEKQATLGTQDNRQRQTKQNKNTTRTTTEMSNPDPTKTLGSTQVLTKGKQFLPLTRNPPCYAYSQYVLDITMRNKYK